MRKILVDLWEMQNTCIVLNCLVGNWLISPISASHGFPGLVKISKQVQMGFLPNVVKIVLFSSDGGGSSGTVSHPRMQGEPGSRLGHAHYLQEAKEQKLAESLFT